MKGAKASVDVDLWLNDDTDIRVEGTMHENWTTLRFDEVRQTIFTTPENIKRIIEVLLVALEERQKEDDADGT